MVDFLFFLVRRQKQEHDYFMLLLGLDFFIGMTVSNILYLQVKHLLFTKGHGKGDTHVKALPIDVCTQPKRNTERTRRENRNWNNSFQHQNTCESEKHFAYSFPICHIHNSLYSADSSKVVHNISNQHIAVFSTGYTIHELLFISSWKYFIFPFLRKNMGAFFLRTSYCLWTANSKVAVLFLPSARPHKLQGSKQQKIHNRYSPSASHI